MSDEGGKTQADQLDDTLAQLKEMRHYASNNVESLTSMWMLFDGELKDLGKTEKIEDLMTKQGELHDAFESMIEDLEDMLSKMREAASASPTG